MGLSGTLNTMPLSDLLNWMDQSRQTGTLEVQGDRYKKTIVVKDGRIIASASNDPNDFLGHFLLREGAISETQLKTGMETQRQTRVMLGRILVTQGVLKPEDLQKALVRKAEETVFGLFLSPDGRFDFRDGMIPEKISVPMNLRIADVLLKGLAWYDEFQHLRKVFPTSKCVLVAGKNPPPQEILSGSPFVRRILHLLDGKRSIADLCLAVHASEFPVSKILYELHKDGHVEIRKAAPAAKAAPRATFSSLLAEARSLLRAGEAEAALKILEEARALAPHDKSLQGLMEEVRAAFVHQAYREGLRPEAVPALAKPLEQLSAASLTPEEMFILSRVNGCWDVRSITSICPFPEHDALLHLKRLKDRGFLALEVPVGT